MDYDQGIRLDLILQRLDSIIRALEEKTERPKEDKADRRKDERRERDL